MKRTRLKWVVLLLSSSLLGAGFVVATEQERFVTVNGADVVVDRATGLEWQADASSTDMDWQDALEYCEFGAGAGVAESTDWRLPNVNELRSLLNYDKHGPATDFPGITEDNDGIFWSSSPYVYIESLAWGVSFASGIVYNSNMDFYYSVRCVRGGP